MPKLRKQDLSKENGGVWLEWEGVRFLIARTGNKATERLREAWAAENRALREEKKPERPYEDGALKVLSEAILLGWEGLDDDDGKPLPYSHEAARKLLSDPRYSDFKEWVEISSLRRENFLEKGEKAAEKNSSALSSQTSASAETSAAH